jgi:hypothetical protein
MTRKTYDERQAAAVLMTCTICGVAVYSTQPMTPFVCILCVQDQERAK